MPVSLRARFIYPVDRPPIENGIVTIDGEHIVGVGTTPAPGATLLDLGDVALLPGLVNAHTHLEFSGLTKPLGSPQASLVDWIRQVIAHRGQRSDSNAAAIAAGCRESLAHGVTTVGDIATAEAASFANLPPLDLTLFVEVIGFSRARAESALQATRERLDALQALSAQKHHLGLSPHAPYTVSPDLLRMLVDLARERNLPVAMHIAESDDEIELLSAATGAFQSLLDERSMWDADAIPPNSRPLDYLRELARAPRALVIHGNHLDDREHRFLADHADRMTLIHCPRTHAYFGREPFPLAKLQAKGIGIALGTDSRASNPDLNLWCEMMHVASVHQELSPQTILRLGTLAGAEALGRAQDIGSITPGKFANLIAMPLASGKATNADDALGSLLATDNTTPAVWINGTGVN